MDKFINRTSLLAVFLFGAFPVMAFSQNLGFGHQSLGMWGIVLGIIIIFSFLYFFRKYQIRKLLETAENIRLKEIDQLKTKLYTNITHEFRTPLTVIMGLAEQLAEEGGQWTRENGLGPSKKEDLPAIIQDRTDFILRNARQLLNLINQMLDLSKLDSGKMSLQWVLGDVVLYLKYLAESFHSYAAIKHIQLAFCPEVKSLEMDYDQEKLQHIVSNLLFNAIKFTPEGGKVDFQVSEAPIVPSNGSKMLQLIITNSGTGISAEHIANIFNRFYQVDDTHTRKSGGSGIGLALTKELVELMGGSISAKSEPSQEVEFTVLLPVRKTAVPKPSLPKIETAMPVSGIKTAELMNSGSLTAESPLLLLIEDNADVAFYIRNCLKSQYTVIWAENGQLGIDKALETVPDLIISDVMMPEKDGYEVTQFLKNDERTSHIPIILLTAKADSRFRIVGLKRGADAYLSKPFDKKELLVRVEALIELRRKLQIRYAGVQLFNLQKADPNNPIPTSEKGVQLEETFLKKVNAVIEKHLSDSNFEVPRLSRELGMSHSQLYRKIKALTGKSIAAYIRSYRLRQGRELLQTTDEYISEIAYSVGFSDPAYFSRTFFEEFHKTPIEIRN